MKKTNTLKRGMTLVEIILVIVIGAILAVVAVNAFSSATGKAKSQNLSTELESASTELSVAQTTEGNAVYQLLLSCPKANISNLAVNCPPSFAFNTVKTQQVLNIPDAMKLTYTLDNAELAVNINGSTAGTAYYEFSGDASAPTATVKLPNLSASAMAGIQPLFVNPDTDFLKDFCFSTSGMNLEQYKTYLIQADGHVDYAKIISIIFGGTTLGDGVVEYNPYADPSASTCRQVIGLTKVDVNRMKSNEALSSLKILNDKQQGTLYIVTTRMGRDDFIAYCNYKDKNAYAILSADNAQIAGEIYDTLAQAFPMNQLVFIPTDLAHAYKTIDNGSKYGLYHR